MLSRSLLSGLIFVLFFTPIAFANKPRYIGPSVNAIVFSTENPKVLYVGTSDGVFKSIDRGLSWVFSDGVVLPTAKEGNTVNQKFEGVCGRVVASVSSPNIMSSICYKDSNIGGHSDFKKSIDFGKTWTLLGDGLPKYWPATALAVDPNNPNVVFAGWVGGGLYRSMDGGKSWKKSDHGLIDKHESFLHYLAQPPLHQAVMDQDLKRVRKLLKKGANVNEVSSTGMTPMLFVARNGKPEMFKLLHSVGAKLDIRDKEGHAPIHMAIVLKNTPIFKALLDAGADLNMPINQNNLVGNTHNTPLTMSITRLNTPIMNLLIENGADLSDPNVMGAAVESKQLSLVMYFFEKGAVLSYENGVGNLLDNAGFLRQPDIVAFLLEKGLKPKNDKYSDPFYRPKAWAPANNQH